MFARSHLAGFSNVNHHGGGFKLDDERTRRKRLPLLGRHLDKRVDEIVDSGESLLFGLSPRHGLLEGGTVRVERLASVLKFILFDDNFENVAFQGVPLIARIPWTALLSHTGTRVAQSQAGRQKARIGCPVLCRAEAARCAG